MKTVLKIDINEKKRRYRHRDKELLATLDEVMSWEMEWREEDLK